MTDLNLEELKIISIWQCVSGNCAVTSKGVYMLTYGIVQVLEMADIKSLNMQSIEKYCTSYEEWGLDA